MHHVTSMPVIVRWGISLLLSAGVLLGLHFVNSWVTSILLYLLLALFFMFVQAALQTRRMQRRFEQRGGFPRGGARPGSGGNGGSGVREPRRPLPSTPPARAVALDPEAESMPQS